MRLHSSYFIMTLALFAFVWTGVGETGNPKLDTTELPLNIVNDCESHDACHGAQDYLTHWVGRTTAGDLFLVRRVPCLADDCGAWFVEKTPRGVETRLAIDGSFRIISGNSPYPDVQTQHVVSDVQTIYAYFTWIGDRYRQTGTREVYRVDGIECTGKSDCYRMGLKALKDGRAGRALDIWQKVNRLSWI